MFSSRNIQPTWQWWEGSEEMNEVGTRGSVLPRHPFARRVRAALGVSLLTILQAKVCLCVTCLVSALWMG